MLVIVGVVVVLVVVYGKQKLYDLSHCPNRTHVGQNTLSLTSSAVVKKQVVQD